MAINVCHETRAPARNLHLGANVLLSEPLRGDIVIAATKKLNIPSAATLKWEQHFSSPSDVIGHSYLHLSFAALRAIPERSTAVSASDRARAPALPLLARLGDT